nr:hypothetical protein [Tanacetum cinerariifolium]
MIKKVNPRELNPYFRNDGRGYPEEEADGAKSRDSNLLSTSIVGDGGASWRLLKAMKRSQEQAAREGKNLDEVVKERWGSLGNLAVSVASNSAAPSHAHLHAIKDRIRQQNRDQPGDQNETERDDSRKGMHAKMRVPRRDESLSWGKRRDVGDRREVSKSEEPSSRADMKPALRANQLAAKVMQLRMKGKHAEADKLLKEAEVDEGKSKTDTIGSSPQGDGTASSLQKFSNDGSFLHQFKGSQQQKNDDSSSTDGGDRRDSKSEEPLSRTDGGDRREVSKSEEPSSRADMKPALSANQLAAKVMQLRMKGKHAEADKLLKEAEQEKEVVFLETVMGLAKQSRHCMIECIPLPPEVAKQAPLYFKKAIDEAEEEWSQHNAKKLIDTSEKGLHRASGMSTLFQCSGAPDRASGMSTLIQCSGVPDRASSMSTLFHCSGVLDRASSMSTLFQRSGVPDRASSMSTLFQCSDVPDRASSMSTLFQRSGVPDRASGMSTLIQCSSVPDRASAYLYQIKKVNPRELNPYFRNDGRGYPEEEADGAKSRDSNLQSTSIVGDGGASWRLKAMKRSQEQAAREGKNLDEETERDDSRKGMHAKMRVPRRDESLSWGKRRG